MKRPRIRLGMVGGGQGAFIGEVHRMAARLDDRFELLAGALSGDSARAAASAADLGLDPKRSYADFGAMAAAESLLEDGIEAVAIVTPNHLHYPAARAFLEAGIHVICDKPLTVSEEEAEALAALVEERGLVFVVTYNYSGYPLIRQAREMVAAGELGNIRVVQIEYAQDWLATPIEAEGQKQASWRTDPARAGAGGSIGDIGTHAYHLAEFVTGLKARSLLADLDSFVAGRTLDDNAHILLHFSNGAKGMLWASQIASGKENGLRLRVYGDRGSLEWSQEEPNQLIHLLLGDTRRVLTRAGAGVTADSATAASRLPSGHPEGYIEGFANLYRDAADLIQAHGDAGTHHSLAPTVMDGLRGVRFVSKAVASNNAGSIWQSLE